VREAVWFKRNGEGKEKSFRELANRKNMVILITNINMNMRI
jgi:hypothetical protein